MAFFRYFGFQLFLYSSTLSPLLQFTPRLCFRFSERFPVPSYSSLLYAVTLLCLRSLPFFRTVPCSPLLTHFRVIPFFPVAPCLCYSLVLSFCDVTPSSFRILLGCFRLRLWPIVLRFYRSFLPFLLVLSHGSCCPVVGSLALRLSTFSPPVVSCLLGSPVDAFCPPVVGSLALQ